MPTAIAIAASPEGDGWVTGAAAARMLDVGDKRAVKRLAEMGKIRVRDLAVRARFLRSDVVRLARESSTQSS